jgi:hypothetical protein
MGKNGLGMGMASGHQADRETPEGYHCVGGDVVLGSMLGSTVRRASTALANDSLIGRPELLVMAGDLTDVYIFQAADLPICHATYRGNR